MTVCKEYEARISALIDDELTPEERVEVMEHLAACPACRAYWEELLTLGDILRTEGSVPAGFADAVMEHVHQTRQEKKVVSFPVWKSFAAIAACCAIAVLGVWMMDGTGGNSMENSAVCNSGAPAESYDMADGREMPSDSSAAYGGVPFQGGEPENSADTQDAALCDDDAAAAVMSTASELAEAWVEENLGEEWRRGASYTLSEEQYEELRNALERAGEPFSEIMGNEIDGYRLMAE